VGGASAPHHAERRLECCAVIELWDSRSAGGEAFGPEEIACVHGCGLYVSCTAIQPSLMTAEKTIAISFRVSPRFKRLLEEAAAREHRSQTNMLEKLLFDYCSLQGVGSLPSLSSKKTASK